MPRITNPYERRHIAHLAQYAKQIDAIYRTAVQEAAAIAAIISDFESSRVFSFNDYPITHQRVQSLLSRLNKSTETAIVNGINAEWTLANNKNNELSQLVFGNNVGRLTPAQYRRYFSTNDNARQAFLQRKEQGLNLSERVWQYTNAFRREIELGLDIGLRNGLSADEMSRELRQYLKYPDKLFRRVRDEHGNLVLSKRAAEFHPGQGVYRSSYKNARRLAVTETNIAYRTADYERYQQLDFVVGIEIRLSNNHTCNGLPLYDICDELCGRYPKDFKFTGWHPHCRCHVVSILKTEEELMRENEAILAGEEPTEESVNRVADVPERFREWIDNNKERAKGWATMPYFVRQNPNYVQGFEVDTYTPAERKFTRARRTKEAMVESLGIYLQKKYPDIPNTEVAAIYHYTRGDLPAYRQLNNQLRKGQLSEFNEAFSELISLGLKKLPTTTKTVYRTIRLNKTRLREWVKCSERKDIKQFPSFISSSSKQSVISEFLQHRKEPKNNETDVLLIIKGKTGHSIEQLSQFSGRIDKLPNQHEVLFDKGTQFKFTQYEQRGTIHTIYMEEV